MKIFFSLLAFLIIQTSSFSQDFKYSGGPFFAISLEPNTQDVITFAIIEFNTKGEVVKRIFLKRTDWIRQIIGIQESIANPDGKNILKEAGFESPDVIEDLWKLRYSEWPYQGSQEKGWAGKPRIPTEGQMEMLKKFGIYKINDYVYGDKLLNLLRSMEDPAWISEYQNK